MKVEGQNRIKEQHSNEEVAKTDGRRQIFFPLVRGKLTGRQGNNGILLP
jgi:hypothetical protein